MRSSPWIGKMLPMSSGSSRSTGTSWPLPSSRRGERLGSGSDAEQLRGARLVGEARRPQRHVSCVAAEAIGARVVGLVGAPVVQALQLVLELRRRQRQPRVQLQRRGIHLRRQRPAPPLELVRDQAIEVHDVADRAPAPRRRRESRCADASDEETPRRARAGCSASSWHARRRRRWRSAARRLRASAAAAGRARARRRFRRSDPRC